MPNVEHANLTGAALHEPKGVATATLGQVYIANGTGSGNWSALTSTSPVGMLADFAGGTAPAGWLLCYGQTVSRTTYAELFAVLGTVYGVGNGTTTFNLPDCRGRATIGKDNMGGSTAGRITNGGCGITGTTLGNTGGFESHTLTEAQLPAHTHANSLNDPGHLHTYTAPSVVSAADQGGPTSGSNPSSNSANTGSQTTGIILTNASVGSNSPHNNVQPVIIFNKIIFANA